MDVYTCPFIGSWCSFSGERWTTCWVTMRVPDPNILVDGHPPLVREGRDLDHHVSACSEGARACWGGGGGGGAGPTFSPALFRLGAAKGPHPCFLVPKGNQPTACTLALWWLKLGPTEKEGAEGLEAADKNGGRRGLGDHLCRVLPHGAGKKVGGGGVQGQLGPYCSN